MIYNIVVTCKNNDTIIKPIKQTAALADNTNPWLIHFINGNNLYIQSDFETVKIPLASVLTVNICNNNLVIKQIYIR